MNVQQTIRSLRAVRHFTDQPLPEDALLRILQAARWTGSAKNSQPWEFIIVRERSTLNRLAACGSYASHLKNAAAAILIATEPGFLSLFDAGRCAQSMMLAAWAEGIGSCIATLHDESCTRAVLGIPETFSAYTAISFGYAQDSSPKTIEGRPREEILKAIGRRSLDDMIHWEKWENRTDRQNVA